MESQPILQCEDLILRTFLPTDAPRIQELAGDERIADTTATIPHPYPDGAAQQWIAESWVKWKTREAANFAITLAPQEELAGAISLMDMGMHMDSAEAELGYWVGVPYWGRGIATCAAKRVVEYGFRQLALRRIHARALTRNPASGKVLLRAGFTHIGTENSICGYQRQEQSTEYYELLAG